MNAIVPIEQSEDPAYIGYPPSLPIEIALKVASLEDLKKEYEFSDEEWSALRYNPLFVKDLSNAHKKVKDGESFKLKAQLQAEELLKENWRLIHNPDTPASVRADLIKSTVRWAGYDAKENAAGAVGNAFQININLG